MFSSIHQGSISWQFLSRPSYWPPHRKCLCLLYLNQMYFLLEMYFFKPQLTRKLPKATKYEKVNLKGTPEESKVNEKTILNGSGVYDQETSLQVKTIVKVGINSLQFQSKSGLIKPETLNAEFSSALTKKFYSEAIYFVFCSLSHQKKHSTNAQILI